MANVSRNQTGRRLLLKEQEARELRRELFRLFGQDPEYRGEVTDDLRDYWQAVALPTEHPDRFNFRALREIAREAAADPVLKRYDDAVEDFVPGELSLKIDETPAEWVGNYAHSRTAPPEHLL